MRTGKIALLLKEVTKRSNLWWDMITMNRHRTLIWALNCVKLAGNEDWLRNIYEFNHVLCLYYITVTIWCSVWIYLLWPLIDGLLWSNLHISLSGKQIPITFFSLGWFLRTCGCLCFTWPIFCLSLSYLTHFKYCSLVDQNQGRGRNIHCFTFLRIIWTRRENWHDSCQYMSGFHCSGEIKVETSWVEIFSEESRYPSSSCWKVYQGQWDSTGNIPTTLHSENWITAGHLDSTTCISINRKWQLLMCSRKMQNEVDFLVEL